MKEIDKNGLPLEKVFFNLDSNEWHGNASESLWAEKLNEITFCLKNSPFYVKGVSYEDIIEADYDDGKLVFKKVIKHGNHSTYRIFLLDEVPTNLFSKYWMKLEKIGCTYEQASDKLYSIDVPKETDVYQAYNLLEDGLNAGIWDFEEGHCGHILKE